MDMLCLDNQLCFKFYALSRQMTAIYRPLLEKLGITYPQYLVMLVLWEDREISVKDLGARLYLDSGTLTPLLQRLEQKGFVIRRRDPADERSVLISLTQAGETLKQAAVEIPEMLGKCLSLNLEQFGQLKQQLDGLLGTLVAQNV
jgi:DNA-binding MarR family transcriptional regulator